MVNGPTPNTAKRHRMPSAVKSLLKSFANWTPQRVWAAAMSASTRVCVRLVDKALSNNMTRDTLNRAAAPGVGGDEDANIETIIL